jgi:hypothetical protein
MNKDAVDSGFVAAARLFLQIYVIKHAPIDPFDPARLVDRDVERVVTDADGDISLFRRAYGRGKNKGARTRRRNSKILSLLFDIRRNGFVNFDLF